MISVRQRDESKSGRMVSEKMSIIWWINSAERVPDNLFICYKMYNTWRGCIIYKYTIGKLSIISMAKRKQVSKNPSSRQDLRVPKKFSSETELCPLFKNSHIPVSLWFISFLFVICVYFCLFVCFCICGCLLNMYLRMLAGSSH